MSFGLNDEDWVNPDESEPIQCKDCDSWTECPCGCGMGWCGDDCCFTDGDSDCVYD